MRAAGHSYREIAEAVGVSVTTLRAWRKTPEYDRIRQEIEAEIEELTLERIRGAAGVAISTLLAVMQDAKASPNSRVNAAQFVWRESGLKVSREGTSVEDMSEADIIELLRQMPPELLHEALAAAG